MRPLMGDAIFGCDICTRVCPWNRFGAKGPPAATEEWRAPDAADCLAMSPKEFKTRFRDTAVFRTGLERLHRNAAVALGNRGDPAAARLLRRCRDATASPLIREHIEWALARCTHRSRHPSDPMT
jgi:epoxyqueuosine reductase